MDNNYGILESEHTLMRVLNGSSIFWVKFNKIHQL